MVDERVCVMWLGATFVHVGEVYVIVFKEVRLRALGQRVAPEGDVAFPRYAQHFRYDLISTGSFFVIERG